MTTSERYEIIQESYEEGGFGKIEKRKDKILDRYVAVKKLKLVTDEEARERFKLEAKTLAKMSHPNIPAIYDIDISSDEMLIYFEYLEGNNLRKIINQKTIPTIEDVRRWFTHIASALQHAHDMGVIHRDVKPENIIISEDHNTAFLVDFGIALTQDDVRKLTASGYVIGTPVYMSPEQRAGDALDGKSDLYSLGLTFYEALSGELPLPGNYKGLSDANEAIPPAIDDLIRKCLATEKQHRIESAKDFIDLLRQATRTDIPLSSLLTDARLHEILAALNQLSPEEFHAKNKGQRFLIISRLKDLIRTDRLELTLATASLISSLLHLATYEEGKLYRIVVEAALKWGFDKQYGDWVGNEDIRQELISVAKLQIGTAHAIISGEFLKFVDKFKSEGDFRSLWGWYVHDLRKIVVALLANPECDNDAEKLNDFYELINRATHIAPTQVENLE